jgi:hypothetical protein
VAISTTEIDAAVELLVRGTVRYQRSYLGSPDRDLTHGDVVEAVGSSLLYEPDAVFYVIRLGLDTFRLTLSTAISIVEQMLVVVDDLAMKARPLNEVRGLAEAEASLRRLDSAAARSGVVSGSEYRRFQRATDQALEDLASVVRQSYVPRGSTTTTTDVIRPREEARSLMRTLFGQLRTSHAALLVRLPELKSSLSDFLSSNLVADVAANQLARVRSRLTTIRADLESLSPADRRLIARNSTLGVLAARATVRGLSERPVPGQPRLQQEISATPTYRLRAYGTGTAPELIGTRCAPFKLRETVTDTLGIDDLNGVPTFDVLLVGGAAPSAVPGVARAELQSQEIAPFQIGPDLATPHPLLSTNGPFNIVAGGSGSVLHLVIDGDVREVALTNGPAVPALTLVNDINLAAAGWVPPSPINAVVDGVAVRIDYQNGAQTPAYRDRVLEACPGFDHATALLPWTVNGVSPLARSQGWDANDEVWIQPNDAPGPVPVPLTPGAWPNYTVTVLSVANDITAAMAGAGEAAEGADVGGRLVIRSQLYGEGSIITMRSDGLRVPPDPRAGLPTPSLLALEALRFTDGDERREADVRAAAVVQRLNIDTSFHAGAVARKENTVFLDALQAYRVGAGVIDDLVLALDSDPLATWPSYVELKVVVTGGDNSGIYGLSAAPTYAAGNLTLHLDRRLRDTTLGLALCIQVYRERLRIQSLDAGLTGIIDLYDPARSARTLLGLSDAPVETTVDQVLVEQNDSLLGWIPLDLSRYHLVPTDLVLDGTEVEQTVVSGVTNVSSGILDVDPGVAPGLVLSTGGFSLVSAWARSHATLLADLSVWLQDTLPPFDDLGDLDRALGRLLLSESGKDVVDVMYDLLDALRTRLDALGVVVDAYQGRRIAAVTRAADLLQEHGYDRARDLLLQARVPEVLSTTSKSASYAGAAQAAFATMAANDLNVSRGMHGESGHAGPVLVSSVLNDEDPLLTFSDMESSTSSEVIEYYRTKEP